MKIFTTTRDGEEITIIRTNTFTRKTGDNYEYLKSILIDTFGGSDNPILQYYKHSSKESCLYFKTDRGAFKYFYPSGKWKVSSRPGIEYNSSNFVSFIWNYLLSEREKSILRSDDRSQCKFNYDDFTFVIDCLTEHLLQNTLREKKKYL